ncbi:MAG: rhodanese-like domain-containing protein [Moraxellaceae bacterium]
MKTLLFVLSFVFFTAFGQSELAPLFFNKAISVEGTSAQILDVRTPEEFETGAINGALHANWLNKEQFVERVKSLDTNKVIYIYCLSGGRSAAAQNWLLENGFHKVINLKGGINAWNQAELPLKGALVVPQITYKGLLASLPKDKVVLVDVGAEWCPPCRKMKHAIEQITQLGYSVVPLDGGVQKECAKALKATTFPTLILFKNGVELDRKQGVFSVEELTTWMNQFSN